MCCLWGVHPAGAYPNYWDTPSDASPFARVAQAKGECSPFNVRPPGLGLRRVAWVVVTGPRERLQHLFDHRERGIPRVGGERIPMQDRRGAHVPGRRGTRAINQAHIDSGGEGGGRHWSSDGLDGFSRREGRKPGATKGGASKRGALRLVGVGPHRTGGWPSRSAGRLLVGGGTRRQNGGSGRDRGRAAWRAAGELEERDEVLGADLRPSIVG